MYELITTLSGYQLKDSLTGHVMSADGKLVNILAEKGAIENVVWKPEQEKFVFLESESLSKKIADSVECFREVSSTFDCPVICGVLGCTLDSTRFHRFFIKQVHNGLLCSYGFIDYVIEDEEYNSCVINWLDEYKWRIGKTFDVIERSKKAGVCFYKDFFKKNGFTYENWVEIGDDEFREYNNFERKIKKSKYLITSKKLVEKPSTMLDSDYEKTDFLFCVPKNRIVLYCTTNREILFVDYNPDN